MSYERALAKAMRYCAYQERCEQDVRKRLIAWNVKTKEHEKIIETLLEQDFLNKSRYIEAYIRGKFKIKNWGKNKIKSGLINKNVYDNSVFNQMVIQEIPEEEYLLVLKRLIEKKRMQINGTDKLVAKDKLYKYLLNKGYEPDLILKHI